MKVLLVAHDRGPSAALKPLAEKLGSESVAFLSGDVPDVKVADFDAVLLGMSCSEEAAWDEMMAAGFADAAGVPFGFFSDTFGVFNRPWFADFREEASFLFVINKEEAEEAREVFPNAKIVASGNPVWEDFFFPKASREEARKKLGVAEGEMMILCAGANVEPALNVLLFGNAIQAAKEITRVRVILAPHPADKEKTVTVYEGLTRYTDVPCQFLRVSASDILPAVDVVIEMFSSIGLEAACQRKPVIGFFTEFSLKKLEQLTGSSTWPPCDKGAIVLLNDGNPRTLAKTMTGLLTSSPTASELRKRQEAVFPKPSRKGTAVQKMVQTIKEVVAK